MQIEQEGKVEQRKDEMLPPLRNDSSVISTIERISNTCRVQDERSATVLQRPRRSLQFVEEDKGKNEQVKLLLHASWRLYT